VPFTITYEGESCHLMEQVLLSLASDRLGGEWAVVVTVEDDPRSPITGLVDAVLSTPGSDPVVRLNPLDPDTFVRVPDAPAQTFPIDRITDLTIP
jgi:hypothetical protein